MSFDGIKHLPFDENFSQNDITSRIVSQNSTILKSTLKCSNTFALVIAALIDSLNIEC
jgi:hypothetical protein